MILFALREGGGSFQLADLALFVAVIAAAMGYAEGGRLSQSMGGQQVIGWALAFSYVSLLSMFIGFFFWYKGLALGGIARVGQVQLLQPFMTLVGATLIVGEALDVSNLLFACVIIVVVAIGRRTVIK